MKNLSLNVAAVAAIAMASTQASALPITVQMVSANWTNVQGGSNISYINTDGKIGNEEIRWGDAVDGVNRSGYRFDGSAPSAFTVQTDDTFSLGTFTHFNFPIYAGTSITGAQLNISANLLVDGVALGEGPFTFSFLHNETPNNCTTSPDCANDLVRFNSLDSTDSFTLNGIEYTLNLAGFIANGQLTDTFSTVEGKANRAQLIGEFTAKGVPEPATLMLLGAGIAGLGLGRSRARQQA